MTARDAALRSLMACRKNGAWSDGVLKEQLKTLDRRDAALASRLCYGVLQNRMLLDFWISGFARGKLQPVVEEVLRLAVYQLRFMDKIPASAAVNEAVEQAKKHANPQAGRFVNGVLRNILRAKDLPLPGDPAVLYSHPKELVDLFVSQFGKEKTLALLKSHNEAPDTVIQVNFLKTTPEETTAALLDAGAECEPEGRLPGCMMVRGTGNLENLPAFQNGWFYVQDAAARMAVEKAELGPGMKVLDCCAAPGGKSFAAAIAMKNQGEITSCDIHPHKLKLIEKGAERLGISIISTRLQDASKPVEEWKGKMDAVLCDVPCSGLGVIRKKPDIRYKDLKQTENLPAVQKKILGNVSAYVRPGGVLIYSTCTVLRRENEAVAEDFLRKHEEFTGEEMKTFLPCDDHTDGFFICKLRRKP